MKPGPKNIRIHPFKTHLIVSCHFRMTVVEVRGKALRRVYIVLPVDLKNALDFLVRNAPFKSTYVFAR